MRVILVRHGETEFIHRFHNGGVRPKSDSLTQTGIEQTEKVAEFIKSQEKPADLIVASPYKRTIQTADILAAALNLPVEINEGLQEYDPGEWGGKSIDEFIELFNTVPSLEQYTFRPVNGESWLDEALRVAKVISEAEKRGLQQVILVSHYDPIKAVVSYLTGLSPDLWQKYVEYGPASVTVLSGTGKDWKLESIKQP